ncbi:MAG: HAD family hydrolase [Acidobacteriaceae bacterium]|nr:HAD family hydrolase [Acidobacteriaceae bacterium]
MGRNKFVERRAVFLDRDGVINRNIRNPATGEYEAPLTPGDFEFLPGALNAMRALRKAGFTLFLVSNQPNYAKGKSTLKNLRAIHRKLAECLSRERIEFARFYYCFHHPAGSRTRYSRPCSCRKPSPYFLLKARTEFNLDLAGSWMIGDRLTDVECGNRAGTRTILIASLNTCSTAALEPDAVARDLRAAARMILTTN